MTSIWKRLGGEIVYDAGIFRVRRDRYERRGRPIHPFHVLEADPWVNVVAVTEADEVVLVRMFRHGIREESLEVPGGLMDPGDADPAAAAARELLEETGYRGEALEPLGAVTSNPAILTNRTHCFLARRARPVAPPAPDDEEELTVELRPVGEIRSLIERGEIHHSLSVCALTLFLLDT